MSSKGRVEPGQPRAATRADVARQAGVSTAVVSFVVNGGPKPVSAQTTRRVRDAIEQLNYRPNRTARALSSGSTKTLGLMGSDTTNPFYAEYTAQLQQTAAERGYALLMTGGSRPRSGPTADAELRAMLDLCDWQIDGLIITRVPRAGLLDDLGRHAPHTPLVIIDAMTPVSGFSTVGPEAGIGMATAVEHLLDHGHRSVCLIMGDAVEATTDGRETGWRQAHDRRGERPGDLVRSAFTRAGGYAAGLDVLQRPERPTAVVTSSDLQASGLLAAAHQLELTVPRDLAVISFDGTEALRYAAPPLTTIRQPTAAMAAAAVDVLVQRHPPEHRTFAMDLVIRRSCGCPP